MNELRTVKTDKLSETILKKHYLLKNKTGQVIETPDEMCWRVAKHVAKAEKQYGSEPKTWAERFYRIMRDMDFLPNSPCLMNAGTESGQLAACFVLSVEDDLKGIFQKVMEAALIHKSGGGTGFSFSRLRPAGDVVASTGGTASGPVSFLYVYNAATEAVNQGGRRRGANMAILRVDHPDIMDFIRVKSQPGNLTNFNLSVAVTSDFMRKAVAGEDYHTINPRTGKTWGSLNARDVLNLIAKVAWRSGDPGLLFLDTVNASNPTPRLGLIEATNPCGEQPLLPNESCNLGSINLTRIVTNGSIDWGKLKKITSLAVRFLDDVIDVTNYPFTNIEQMCKGNRKIGLGIMGFADMLYVLGIPYDSDEAVEIGENIMREISNMARETSKELAMEKGPFPNLKGSIYDKSGGLVIRNATQTTIAPTGTVSLIAGVSSGIEPNYALAYERKIGDQKVMILNSVFERIARERNFFTPELIEYVLRRGSLSGIEGIPKNAKRVFVTALDIKTDCHVRLQAAFQKYTDNGVSKTVNLPENESVGTVRDVFLLAWKLGCKGITVYRDGSQQDQVLVKGEKCSTNILPRERPEKTLGVTKKAKIGCGNLYITVNRDKLGLCEVFTNVGRGGGCPSQAEATSRLASIALRAGISPAEIVEQIKGIRCLSTLTASKKRAGIHVLSCPDAIGRAMEEFLNGNTDNPDVLFLEKCQECGSILEHEGSRCVICRFCGFSRCF